MGPRGGTQDAGDSSWTPMQFGCLLARNAWLHFCRTMLCNSLPAPPASLHFFLPKLQAPPACLFPAFRGPSANISWPAPSKTHVAGAALLRDLCLYLATTGKTTKFRQCFVNFNIIHLQTPLIKITHIHFWSRHFSYLNKGGY